MTWTTRDPRTYPARFPSALRAAAASSPSPYLIGGFASLAAAEAEATIFRRYRFLIRQSPGIDFSLASLLSSHNYRTRVVKAPLGIYELHLIAKPLPASELEALNPHLADLFRL